MSGEVQLTLHTNRTVFPVTDQPQLVYILIEAMPAGAAADVLMPLNFSLVLDHSGSMDGEKIEALRDAACLAIDQMSTQDTASIVVFDDFASLVVPSQPVVDPEALKARVGSIEAGGGTKMSTGMKQGLDELEKAAKPGCINRMLLLTDGETYGDADQCRKLANLAGARDIAITALGLGADWNESLLDEIASSSGGVADFVPARQPETILNTFQREVRSAQATVIQDAALLLRLASGAIPRAVWRVSPLISKLDHRALSDRDVQVILGDMDAEQGQTVLVELMVAPHQAGTYRLAQAEISYNVAALGMVDEKARTDVVLSFTPDSALVSEPDPEILNTVEKVTAHKLQTRALDEAAIGNLVGATQKLRAAATRLLNMGEDDLAQTALDEASRLEQGQGLSSQGTKKLRYETRKLTQKQED